MEQTENDEVFEDGLDEFYQTKNNTKRELENFEKLAENVKAETENYAKRIKHSAKMETFLAKTFNIPMSKCSYIAQKIDENKDFDVKSYLLSGQIDLGIAKKSIAITGETIDVENGPNKPVTTQPVNEPVVEEPAEEPKEIVEKIKRKKTTVQLSFGKTVIDVGDNTTVTVGNSLYVTKKDLGEEFSK